MIKAAVAFEAGKPLSIEEVELQGPKAGGAGGDQGDGKLPPAKINDAFTLMEEGKSIRSVIVYD